MKVYYPTDLKIPANNWKDGKVVKAANADTLNQILKTKRNEIEKRLLDVIRIGEDISKPQLAEIVKNKRVSLEHFHDFISTIAGELDGKLSKGRLNHYQTMAAKVAPLGAKISSITVKWLQDFEAHLRKPDKDGKRLDGNTIKSNMAILKACLNKAVDKGLIEKKQFEKYKIPTYTQKLPVYLTEPELDKIKDFADNIEKRGHKIAAYYFLLSSYTGYRISDSKRFNYEEMVHDGKIVLRATKNKEIVSIPIYPKLQSILDFVKDHPFDLSEPKARQYIKEICNFKGIKKQVKFHSSRNSFCMMLIDKGFSLDEVARLIGDTLDVARIYGHISNPHLEKRFKELMG